MTLSFLILSIYYLFYFLTFYNLKFSILFEKNFYDNWKTYLKMILISIALSLTVLGILFRLNFYSVAYYFITIGLFLLTAAQFNLNNLSLKNEFINLATTFKRISIVGFIALFVMVLPSKRLFYFLDRNRPEYIHAVFASWDDPNNEQLQKEVERLKYENK